MRLLWVTASGNGEASMSTQISGELIDRLKVARPEIEVIRRDVSAQPLPHFGVQKDALELSDQLCAELKSVTLLVVATPMWNFSIPSSLKAWVDHIVRAGVSFAYDQNGKPQGLLTQLQSVYIVEATGGEYLEGQAIEFNHVGRYLKQIFAFLGARSCEVISVSGTVVDQARAIERARISIQKSSACSLS